jgi:hypothetical protein
MHAHARACAILAAAIGLSAATAGAQPFVIDNTAPPQWSPVGAYDGINNRYLIGYTDNDGPQTSWCTPATSCTANVTTRLLNGSGGFLGETVIAATPYEAEKEPAIAFNPILRNHLVAYYDNTRSNVRSGCSIANGQFFNWSAIRTKVVGGSGGASGGATISDPGLYYWHNVRPRVAYNANARVYLVVWQAATRESVCTNGIAGADWKVRARFVAENGAPIGPIFQPPYVTHVQGTPDVASHYFNDRFMVVWQDGRLGKGRIFAQMIRLVNGAPARVFGYDLIVGASAYQDRFPRVVYNPTNNEWVATWYGARGTFTQDLSGQVWAQRLRGSDGYWMTPSHTPIYTPTNGGHPDVIYCTALQRFWFSWQLDGGHVRLSAFNRNLGRLADYTISTSGKSPAFAEGYRLASPPDACKPDGTTLVLWETLGGDVLGQFVR